MQPHIQLKIDAALRKERVRRAIDQIRERLRSCDKLLKNWDVADLSRDSPEWELADELFNAATKAQETMNMLVEGRVNDHAASKA